MSQLDRQHSNKLIDPMGRPITYLRVSLTEHCNLRCSYCYGSGKLTSNSKEQLSDSEILRLLRAFASLGINKVRFTGGEPLVRKGIVALIKQVSNLKGISLIGLTTNGLALDPLLTPLIKAGLNRLNISD